MKRTLLCLGFLSAVLLATTFRARPLESAQPESAAAEDAKRLRRPVALAFSPKERFVYTANRRSGSISVVDTRSWRVVGETDAGEKLSDIEHLGGELYAASDEQAHELLLLHAKGAQVDVLQRLPVAPYPVGLAFDAERRRLYVSSLWSRRVTAVEFDSAEKGKPHLDVAAVIDLEIAPRKLLLAEGGTRLIAADSFEGRLAIIDTTRDRPLCERKFYAHNIRGLGLVNDGKTVVVAYAMLNEYATTVRNDIHWGMLMSNDLRWLRTKFVVNPMGDFYGGSHVHPLGEPNRGGADPGEISVAKNGMIVVTMSGANKIAFGHQEDFGLRRAKVGRRPEAVVVTSDSKRAVVANRFDDSLSIVDLSEGEEVGRVALGEQPPLSLADRGEMLFHDGRLSLDAWMTCHSCHTDGHTNGQLNDNFSDESFGAPKRVLSLLGVADTTPHSWLGKQESLVDQAKRSSRITMQGPGIEEDEARAIAAYMQTLEPPPSVDRLRGTLDKEAVKRGEAVFLANRCQSCHAPPVYTKPRAYSVGLVDKQGNKHFNPPSLRGLSQKGPFFHDNRAKSLEDVFKVHQHKLREPLRKKELHDLLAFLRSL